MAHAVLLPMHTGAQGSSLSLSSAELVRNPPAHKDPGCHFILRSASKLTHITKAYAHLQ